MQHCACAVAAAIDRGSSADPLVPVWPGSGRKASHAWRCSAAGHVPAAVSVRLPCCPLRPCSGTVGKQLRSADG